MSWPSVMEFAQMPGTIPGSSPGRASWKRLRLAIDRHQHVDEFAVAGEWQQQARIVVDAMGGIDLDLVQHRALFADALQIVLMHHDAELDRKSTRLNSSHGYISYAVFCLKKK